MIRRLGQFGLMFSLTCTLQYSLHAQSCTNASGYGTHFYVLHGEETSPGSLSTGLPYATLGQITLDGIGGASGKLTSNANGVSTPATFTGSYSVNPNCTVTETLSVTPQAGSKFTSTAIVQSVDSGTSTLNMTTTSSVVLYGQSYYAAGAGAAQCDIGSLNGSYGFQLYQTEIPSYAPAAYVGTVTADGQGGITWSDMRNQGGQGSTSQSGTGTYTIAGDCSGTATLTGSNGATTLALGLVRGGGAQFVETDGTSVGYGELDPVAVPSVLGQLAFGGGWYSAMYFSNGSPGAVSFPVNFFADQGTPLNVPSLGTTTTVTVPAHGDAILEALNVGLLAQGYAVFSMPIGVSGYGVFRQSVAGKPDQEAVVPFSSAIARNVSLVWDDSNGLTTSIAFANPSTEAATGVITVTDNNGNAVGTSPISLAPQSKTEAVMSGLPGLAGMIGLRGTAVFTVTSGNIVVLGLRFGASAFTSIPTL